VSGDRAVELVGAGLQLADVELGARAGIEVLGDQVLAPHGEVVDHRPVVANGQDARRGDLRGRHVDRELRQVGLHGLPGRRALVVIGGAEGEPDADDARQGGKNAEGQDEEGPRVAADPKALEIVLEGVEARVIIGHGVGHVVILWSPRGRGVGRQSRVSGTLVPIRTTVRRSGRTALPATGRRSYRRP
jgi:hypothetical protein